MKRLLCCLFGHKWGYYSKGTCLMGASSGSICMRCGLAGDDYVTGEISFKEEVE